MQINPSEGHPEIARLSKAVLGFLKECFSSISLRESFVVIVCDIIFMLKPKPNAQFLNELAAYLKLSAASKLMVGLSLVQETSETSPELYQEALNFLIAVFTDLPLPPQRSIIVCDGPFLAYLNSFLDNNVDFTAYKYSITCTQTMYAAGGASSGSNRPYVLSLLPLVPAYGPADPAGILYKLGPSCSVNMAMFRTHVFSRLTRPLTEKDVVYMIEAILK